MIMETWGEGMPIMQVEMELLAEPADRAGHVEHARQCAAHRVLHLGGELGQPAVPGVKVPEAQTRMTAGEAGRGLPYPDVADVEAAADPLRVLQPLRHLDEPGWLQAGGVLEIDQRSVRPLAQARVEVTHPGQQPIRLRCHLSFVVDDQAGHPARIAAGELGHDGAARLMQHVDATVQVD